MDDRTLLEKAAQAAGLQTRPDWFDPLLGVAVVEDMRGPAERWNPLRDDALALRLAVKLKIEVVPHEFSIGGTPITVAYVKVDGGDEGQSELREPDPCAATRRAIVRAAALSGAGTRTASDE